MHWLLLLTYIVTFVAGCFAHKYSTKAKQSAVTEANELREHLAKTIAPK
jgi:hypothetical protein